MSSMICREFVCNLLEFLLHRKIFTYHSLLFTTLVDYFFLILNT